MEATQNVPQDSLPASIPDPQFRDTRRGGCEIISQYNDLDSVAIGELLDIAAIPRRYFTGVEHRIVGPTTDGPPSRTCVVIPDDLTGDDLERVLVEAIGYAVLKLIRPAVLHVPRMPLFVPAGVPVNAPGWPIVEMPPDAWLHGWYMRGPGTHNHTLYGEKMNEAWRSQVKADLNRRTGFGFHAGVSLEVKA